MTEVFSLKPRYAHAVVEGCKTIEVRRGRICASISSMVIYATKPERLVLRTVDVLRVEHLTAEGFERFLTSRRDPLEPEYRNYAAGAAWITVLHLASPRRLVRPMPLQELVPGLRAPQMWCRTEIELPPELLHPAAFRQGGPGNR